MDSDLWFRKTDVGKKLHEVEAFCTQACRDLGHPAHPVTK